MSARPMVDESAGILSVGEGESDPRRSIDSARRHYTEVLAVARTAARELREKLVGEGVPARREFPDGSFGALEAAKCAQAFRLINAFAWANTRLWLAAQMVCDVEDLKDDGAAEGIVWEALL